jgi:hypothetical protein
MKNCRAYSKEAIRFLLIVHICSSRQAFVLPCRLLPLFEALLPSLQNQFQKFIRP